MKSKPNAASTASGCGTIPMVGFFLIFALAGSVTAYFLTIRPIQGLIAAQSWEAVSCTILRSGVESSSDGDTYRIDVAYEYAFAGRDYVGERYDFSMGYSSGYAAKSEAAAAYPQGLETLCFVDPDDPASSVIDRSPGSYLFWGLFPLPFLAVGFGGLFGIWFMGRNSESKASTAGGFKSAGLMGKSAATSGSAEKTVRRFSSGELFDDGGIDPTGALVLESASTPLVRGIVLVLVALFWNGITGFGIHSTISEGGPSWTTLFFVPFVLVGLALIGAAFHQLLAATNPRPRLVLTPARPILGAACDLRWSLVGRRAKIDRLTIKLEGLEAATYRRGTSTTTDRESFYEEVLYEGRPDPRFAWRMSSLNLAVPERSMPSFEADNNKIEWRVTVHGDIPRWPDINEEFALTVAAPSSGLAPSREPVDALFSPSGESPGGLEVRLEHASYEPGELVRGRVIWNRSVAGPTESLLISLLWYTEGKGTEDAHVQEQKRIELPATQDQSFELRLPDFPWSFSGDLISLIWTVEAVLQPGDVVARTNLVAAPGGVEILLRGAPHETPRQTDFL